MTTDIVYFDVAVGHITVGKERRKLDETKVVELMGSIEQLGLLNAVHVRPLPIGGHILVTGGHRFEACKRLGWERIPAILVDMTDHEAERAEIDENLCRADLDITERVRLTARRSELDLLIRAEREVADTVHDVDSVKSKRHQARRAGEETGEDLGSARDIAKKTGRRKSAVANDVRRGKVIGDAMLSQLKGTTLATVVELDAIVKRLRPNGLKGPEDPTARAYVEALVARAMTGEKVSARTLDGSPLERKKPTRKPKAEPAEPAEDLVQEHIQDVVDAAGPVITSAFDSRLRGRQLVRILMEVMKEKVSAAELKECWPHVEALKEFFDD